MRVRAGAHIGIPTCSVDPVTGRMDYLGKHPSGTSLIVKGSTVNKAARVTSMAAGGQVLISSDMWEVIKSEVLDVHLDVKDLGSFVLKGLQDKTDIMQVLPIELAEREFPNPIHNFQSNEMEAQLQTLLRENQELKSKLINLEKELNQISSFSLELEKRYNREKLSKEISTGSLKELIDAVTLNAALNEQVLTIKTRMTGLNEDTEQMGKQLNAVIQQKNILMEERDSLARKLANVEAEKHKLRQELANHRHLQVNAPTTVETTDLLTVKDYRTPRIKSPRECASTNPQKSPRETKKSPRETKKSPREAKKSPRETRGEFSSTLDPDVNGKNREMLTSSSEKRTKATRSARRAIDRSLSVPPIMVSPEDEEFEREKKHPLEKSREKLLLPLTLGKKELAAVQKRKETLPNVSANVRTFDFQDLDKSALHQRRFTYEG